MSPKLGASLVIGLVNNMPDVAKRVADEQFTLSLVGAAPHLTIDIRRFAPVPTDRHAPIETLWDTKLDGLIVTGAEPRADRIDHEPSWPLLSRLVDWAAQHTRMTIWSCLAAHAAACRLDGVKRRRLAQKMSGVFACTGTAAHSLLDGAPDAWNVPHSRVHDLDVDEVQSAGYTILSRCDAVSSIDTFERTVGGSRFLMLQGHPEYAADTLLREYRRDIKRSLAGNQTDWPPPPEGYLHPDTHAEMIRLAHSEAALAELDAAPVPQANWQPHAARLFGAWLAELAATSHPASLSVP